MFEAYSDDDYLLIEQKTDEKYYWSEITAIAKGDPLQPIIEKCAAFVEQEETPNPTLTDVPIFARYSNKGLDFAEINYEWLWHWQPTTTLFATYRFDYLRAAVEADITDVKLANVRLSETGHTMYKPHQRLHILSLIDLLGLSESQAAERFAIKPATLSSWKRALDDGQLCHNAPMPYVFMRYPKRDTSDADLLHFATRQTAETTH